MKVEILGDGEPEYAVVACVHGDEPEGWEAIQKFKESDYEIKEPLKVILANEEAKAEGERFLEKDLNRVFPGNPEGVHEERLAAKLFDELQGMKALDLHTTNSREASFAIISNPGETEKNLAESTGIEKVVDMSFLEGGMDDELNIVVAEASRDGETTDRLYRVLINFLAAEGIIDEEFRQEDPEFFQVYNMEEGADYRFTAENFRLVQEGEVFAEKENDAKTASKDFYPVLMSTDGYDDMIGFKARKAEL
ncbi:MAG: succinylglutamate desuccinylase [Nanohaloarchaea archaeon QH_8_44_6]|nr:MAG: succinylglutamate desuccinylase [Nanohaloarchaea archaeon QH_8_44_6]